MSSYASKQDSSLVVFIDNILRDTVDASTQKDATAVPGISTSLSQDTQDTTDNTDVSSLSRFDRLLDLNPCMISFSSGSTATKFTGTSSSAVVKERQCLECKKCCREFSNGEYDVERVITSLSTSLLDEEVDEPLESTTKKVYYHKNCAQIKQYRNKHYQGFEIVLKDMTERSRAIELGAERKRMKEEEAIRLEAEEKEYSCPEEDKKMESSKKKKKVMTKNLLKHFKNKFSSCRGKNGTTDAVILSGYQEYVNNKNSRMYMW